jgi:hypothetical protein
MPPPYGHVAVPPSFERSGPQQDLVVLDQPLRRLAR